MNNETHKVDVLERILNCGESMRDVHDAVAELIEAAWNASAVLGHAYHTNLVGSLAEEAHNAYQQLDGALSLTEAGKADSAGGDADYKSNASLKAEITNLKKALERKVQEIESTKHLLASHFKNVDPMPGDCMIGVNRGVTLYGYAVDVVNQLKNERGGK